MLELLDKIDKQVFLYLNSFHNEWSDTAWQTITNIPTWIPLYIFIFVVMVLVFKKDSMYMIAGMLLVVLISDQFTSSFMKPYFGRLRPCYDPQIASMVHVVKSCGGRFGFASGHSANSFGIAIFVWLVFRHYDKSFFAMFLWAFFVAFSRIMVGVHYPGDIMAGALVGLLFGWLVFKLTEEMYFRINLQPLIRN
jgi:undecaprenyl-diphosphatase